MSMSKIKFNYDGVDYTLAFTAASIKKMERDGFNFADVEKHILTAPEDLFCGAFIAHHPYVKREKRIEIFNALRSNAETGESIMDAIGSMLAEAVDEISGHSGNVTWVVEK